LYPKLDGKLVAAVGPVFSYYEFPLIGTKRLNDDEWKKMLRWDNRTEYLPKWLNDIYGKAEAWPTPEYPSIPTLTVILALTLAIVTATRIGKNRKHLVQENS
jgi:hypothetical protein